MSASILGDPGCFLISKRSSQGSSAGAIALEPDISLRSPNNAVLIMDVRLEENDDIAPITCMGNRKIIYTYGKNFGNVSIDGIVLMGPNVAQDQGVNRVLSYFRWMRLATRGAPVSLSMGKTGQAFFVGLTGFVMGQVDRQFHVQPFALSGIKTEDL